MAKRPTNQPKKDKKGNLGPLLILGGIAVVGLGAVYLIATRLGGSGGSGFGFTPGGGGVGGQNILPQLFPPVGQNPYYNPLTGSYMPMGTAPGYQPGSPQVTQPDLSQLQTGMVPSYQQNMFCDPTLGLYWNPQTGSCVQQLAGRNGQCSPGSVWNNCQCQCVPMGVAQPQCYRDCSSSCPDKVNTQWSWCTLGCIPKSAAYGDPSLLSCPPLQGSSTSTALYNPGINALNVAGQQRGIVAAVS